MVNTPIRILHVIGVMDRGGAENMIMNLYRNIDREKIQFDFVEHSDKHAAFDDEIEELGGRIFRCPFFNGKNRSEYKKWWNDFLKDHHQEFAAVHGHVGRSAGVYSKIAKKYGMYTIVHSHSTAPKGISYILTKLYSLPVRHIADYFFACSNESGKSRYGSKITGNPDIYKTLHNSIDTGRFKYNEAIRNAKRKEYSLVDKIVIGHVGRFVYAKNHTFLVDVFNEVYKENNNATLLLVGDGELKKEIEAKVNELGLENAVAFAGVKEDVSAYYQAMDAFLFPSIYEGLALSMVEAQTSGLKCFISDTVSKECIITENQVLVCSLNDSAKTWADTVLKNINYNRTDSSEQVIRQGYDIDDTAKWITDFYLGIRKNGK